MKDIERFIEEFKKGHDVEDCFLHGNCYHFALILSELFVGPNNEPAEICYDHVEGHFYCKIYDNYYDIRGKVTPENIPIDILTLIVEDPLLYDRLLRDCVYKGVLEFEEEEDIFEKMPDEQLTFW